MHIRLNHPGGALGYRFDSPEGSVCIIIDHEHSHEGLSDSANVLVKKADKALYFSKANGKNQVTVYHHKYMQLIISDQKILLEDINAFINDLKI